MVCKCETCRHERTDVTIDRDDVLTAISVIDQFLAEGGECQCTDEYECLTCRARHVREDLDDAVRTFTSVQDRIG